MVSNGARGGTRTHTPVRTTRFKRVAFTSYATRAHRPRYRSHSAGTQRPLQPCRQPPPVCATQHGGPSSAALQYPQVSVAAVANGWRSSPKTPSAGRGWNRRRAPIRSQSYRCFTPTAGREGSATDVPPALDRRRRYAAAAALDRSGLAAIERPELAFADGSPTSPSRSTASHKADRTKSALAPARRLATTIPSIMSASTAPRGRPRRRTDTSGRPALRRIERSRSGRLGGLAKSGTTRSRNRVARPRERAAEAKASEVMPEVVPEVVPIDRYRRAGV